jgi:hypothetical protein
VLGHNKFTPSTKDLFDGTPKEFGARAFSKYYQNPAKNDPVYKPRLTIYERYGINGREIPLKIELSLPKLLYGNNVDEIYQNDYGKIVEVLTTRLFAMGVQLYQSGLANAQVSAIHFSKNILLDNFTTASMVIRELNKIDLNGNFDLTEKQYRNNGQALYFYADSYNIIFYDKWADMMKSAKRATDKDQTPQQLLLFKEHQQLNQPKNILKFEIRITNKNKLKSILKEMNFDDDLVFSKLYNEDLAKKVIQYFWQEMVSNKAYALNACQPKLSELFIKILNYLDEHKSLKDDLAIFGALAYIRDEGIRGLKEIIERYYSERTWKRLKAMLKLYGDNQPPIFFLKQISDALEKFKPLKTEDIGLSTLNVYKSIL